jgi:hypothetical protein
VLKVLPYMSWFPYDGMRKVACIAGRQYTRQAGGDLVYITQLPPQTQNNTTHIAQDVRLRPQQPSQQTVWVIRDDTERYDPTCVQYKKRNKRHQLHAWAIVG